MVVCACVKSERQMALGANKQVIASGSCINVAKNLL